MDEEFQGADIGPAVHNIAGGPDPTGQWFEGQQGNPAEALDEQSKKERQSLFVATLFSGICTFWMMFFGSFDSTFVDYTIGAVSTLVVGFQTSMVMRTFITGCSGRILLGVVVGVMSVFGALASFNPFLSAFILFVTLMVVANFLEATPRKKQLGHN